MMHAADHGYLFWLLLALNVTVRAQTQSALIEPLSNAAFTATSRYSSSWAPHKAKYSSNSYAWASGSCCNVPNEYLQIDLGRPVKIYSIGTKGSTAAGIDFTRSYEFYYSLSAPTAFASNDEMTLLGTLDGNTAATIEALTTLDTPIVARYIKFRPTSYYGYIVLRVEVYGHDTLSPTSSPTAPPTKTPTGSPTSFPSASPTASPSKHPTATPSSNPTKVPSSTPTLSPSKFPTRAPTKTPSEAPTSSLTTSTSNDEQGEQDGEIDESATTTSSLQDNDDQGEPATDSFAGIDPQSLPLTVYIVAGIVVLACLLLCCAFCVIRKRREVKEIQEGFSHAVKAKSEIVANSTSKTTKARLASVSSSSPMNYESNATNLGQTAQEGAHEDTEAVVIRITNRRSTGGLDDVHNTEKHNARRPIEMHNPYGIELGGVPPPPPAPQKATTDDDDDDDDVLMDAKMTTRSSANEHVKIQAGGFEHNSYVDQTDSVHHGVSSNGDVADHMYNDDEDDDVVLATMTTGR